MAVVKYTYYNENDPFAADWLENLIRAAHIAPGPVDRRSVEEVRGDDLADFAQCHFFAGIGVWSHALRLAGWPDDRPVWTGSCPCQPFSAAGLGRGFDDERHLWPAWHRLVRERRPPVIFGEQVASSDVIGRSRPKDLLGMWEMQEDLGFFENGMETILSDYLQELQEREGQTMAQVAEIVCGRESGSNGGWCEGQSGKEGIEFRSDRGVGKEKTAGECLRDNRNSVQPRCRPTLEYSLPGPDNPQGRIYDEQYQNGAVCRERDARELGRKQGKSSGARGPGNEDIGIERFIEALGLVAEVTHGSTWVDTLFADLERAHYTVGTCNTVAAGVGAPHVRQRLYWVAHALRDGRVGRRPGEEIGGPVEPEPLRPGEAGGLGHALRSPRRRDAGGGGGEEEERGGARGADGDGRHGPGEAGHAGGTRPTDGHWRAADWLLCTDGRWRPAQPGAQPLAHGYPGRVGRLRAYGNAIVAPLAVQFVRSVMEELQ